MDEELEEGVRYIPQFNTQTLSEHHAGVAEYNPHRPIARRKKKFSTGFYGHDFTRSLTQLLVLLSYSPLQSRKSRL